MPLKNTETISIFYPKLPLYNPQMRTGFRPYETKTKRTSSNYDKFKKLPTHNNGTRYLLKTLRVTSVAHTLHPTQKPTKLLEYLIKTYTNEGMAVLDNVMGSGSTGIAAIRTNRNFIGIEQSEEYYNVAQKRIIEERASQLKIDK